MLRSPDRRRFLRNTFTAGALATLGGGQAPGSAPREEAAANPRVRPGRVRWHESFEAACAAGGNSGKPVLLFHMMGRMDQKFC